MPPSHSFVQAPPGNPSGSRKRTHAEITRSESRSQSPHPPSKRRRTVSSAAGARDSSSQDSNTQSSTGGRFIGDGLDFRTPVMSSTSSSHQNVVQDTIDLTQDDDSPPPRSIHTGNPTQDTGPIQNVRLSLPHVQPLLRATQPTQHYETQNYHVIDLSSDDEDQRPLRTEFSEALGSPSPEVQFIRERTLPQPRRIENHPPRIPRLPTPPGLRGHFGTNFGGMAAFLRDNLPNVFGNLRRAHELPEEALNRIDGLPEPHNAARAGLVEEPDLGLDEYDTMQLNYARQGWNLGSDLLIIEDTNPHPVPAAVPPPTYKEPVPARDGFTRNYEEDDMLICGFCGDELATGKTDEKQQVWIIKQCGHAYCGDCAHNRIVTKSRNNKETKRVANKKTNGFRHCTVPGCGKAVDSKTKMFQIYL